ADVRAVLAPYEAATGLRLEDLLEAFRDGDWTSNGRNISYGGPRWAAIADAVVRLRDALAAEDHAEAEEQTRKLAGLQHNNGPLINKFRALERHPRAAKTDVRARTARMTARKTHGGTEMTVQF